MCGIVCLGERLKLAGGVEGSSSRQYSPAKRCALAASLWRVWCCVVVSLCRDDLLVQAAAPMSHPPHLARQLIARFWTGHSPPVVKLPKKGGRPLVDQQRQVGVQLPRRAQRAWKACVHACVFVRECVWGGKGNQQWQVGVQLPRGAPGCWVWGV